MTSYWDSFIIFCDDASSSIESSLSKFNGFVSAKIDGCVAYIAGKIGRAVEFVSNVLIKTYNLQVSIFKNIITLITSIYDFFGVVWVFLKCYKRGTITNSMIKESIALNLRTWLAKKLLIGYLVKTQITQDSSDSENRRPKVLGSVHHLYYYDGNNLKCICFSQTRKLRQIIQAHTINPEGSGGRDVSEDVLRKIGSGDFHGIPTTPKILGYHDGLKISYRYKPDVFYSADEIIEEEYPGTDEE